MHTTIFHVVSRGWAHLHGSLVRQDRPEVVDVPDHGVLERDPSVPRLVRALRQISRASRTLLSLPGLTCSRRSPPPSCDGPGARPGEVLGVLEVHVDELLSGELRAAAGLPNCTRSFEPPVTRTNGTALVALPLSRE